MIKQFFLYLFILSTKFYFAQTAITLPIIPLPNKCILQNGEFILSPKTTIYFNDKRLLNHINYFNDYLKKNNQFELSIVKDSSKINSIILECKNDPNQIHESYHLLINSNKITIKGDTAGVFYALQSLVQLINNQTSNIIKLPCLIINDEPAFKWRGMHLDVSRHFFPISFIKRYIDFLALYKLNVFHWHLTDDQGWRIEIKKYPKLIQIGAFRKGTMFGKYSDSNYDTINYGGYYTQEEIKDAVAYAQKRQITILPEIEMPGHSQAAIASYPFLSCTGKPQEVAKGWGVFEDVFCTKDSTFQFLKDVLDEVMILFPGKYIHIGGDECPKTRWKKCLHCQSIIKKENLKDEHELQSYFIKRIEKYINSNGKQIIGWDEILEGGLAPNAAVMSWRGEDGGISAAKDNHFVVMSPGTHCYFDHYQASPSDEPLAIGGFTSLEKVYSYNPIPKELNEEQKKYIMGAQANVWTEYILNEKQVEYMSMPRMAALSEVLWTHKENKNETNFLIRLQKHFTLLDNLKVNYAKALFQINYKIRNDINKQKLFIELNANSSLGDIYYSLNGSDPNINSIKYNTPIELNGQVNIKTALYKNGQLKGKVSSRQYQINKATNKTIVFKTPPSKYYNTGGYFTLINGESATLPRINDQWLGWSGPDIELVINLDKSQEISNIEIGFLKEELNWIYLPLEVTLYLSDDGINFSEIQKLKSNQIKDERVACFNFKKQKAMYAKIIAKNYGKILSGKPGAGENSWLFCDEIKIN